jgi:hypothetical protein
MENWQLIHTANQFSNQHRLARAERNFALAAARLGADEGRQGHLQRLFRRRPAQA